MSNTNEIEINTNVPDKEERKRLRKKRIDKRNTNDSNNNEEIYDKEKDLSKTGQQQVSDSLFSLDRRKHTGLQAVTSIRVNTDTLETKRRIDEEELRKERLRKLQYEAVGSAKANAAIEMKWAELMERDIPQELHHDIQSQMSACNNALRGKDELIGEFQRQLRGKDEEYVRTLRKQAEDIEELLVRIRREFNELQIEYDKEIDAIEEAYLEERERLINEHTTELESMFEHRRNKEIFYKDTKAKREDQYQRDIEELITKGADQYNKVKIELEMNIQTLKQQLEEIRATYQLNTEKLDYNYRVLTEFDVEKRIELTRYKRRLANLKEQLNQLVSKYTELETADSKMNNELTNDYRNLTRKYKELQAKFRHFEVADTSKYDEMWAMHEDEAKDMVDQLLKADKIITEQQLGWLFKPPDLQALQTALGRHGNLGAAQVQEAQAEKGPENTELDGTGEGKVSGVRIRAVLRLIAQEAGFLINPTIKAMIEEMPDKEADLTKAETMLKALGVKSEQSLHNLVTYFFKDTYLRPLTADAEVDSPEELESELLLLNAPEDVLDLKEIIRAEDVISAIKVYMEDISVEGTGATGPVAGTAKAKEEEERIRQRRLQNIQNYWIQLSQVVSDSTVDVWRQLEQNSNILRELLLKRSAAVADVDYQLNRNTELKRLLNQYLGDNRVNGALQIPPAQVMKVRDVSKTVKMTKAGKVDKKLDVLMSKTT